MTLRNFWIENSTNCNVGDKERERRGMQIMQERVKVSIEGGAFLSKYGMLVNQTTCLIASSHTLGAPPKVTKITLMLSRLPCEIKHKAIKTPGRLALIT